MFSLMSAQSRWSANLVDWGGLGRDETQHTNASIIYSREASFESNEICSPSAAKIDDTRSASSAHIRIVKNETLFYVVRQACERMTLPQVPLFMSTSLLMLIL